MSTPPTPARQDVSGIPAPSEGFVLTHLLIVAPPQSSHVLTSALNIRVADVQAIYNEWRARGAEFLTEPKDRGVEIRCYLRDPDGHLIEVGQSTGLIERR